jgi:hypothetical protein
MRELEVMWWLDEPRSGVLAIAERPRGTGKVVMEVLWGTRLLGGKLIKKVWLPRDAEGRCLKVLGTSWLEKQVKPPETLTLKLAVSVFAETLENLQHSMRLISESRSYMMNCSRENLWTRFVCRTIVKTICTWLLAQINIFQKIRKIVSLGLKGITLTDHFCYTDAVCRCM